MFLFDEVNFVQTQNLPISELWFFLPFGYLITILIETPILLAGLPQKLTVRQRLASGVWLTACTYPIVVIVLAMIFYGSSRTTYLLVAETFAPLAECMLFWLVFRAKVILETRDWIRSFAVIVLANLASFGMGEFMGSMGWFGLI